MRYVVGIDGGNSKTFAVLTDETGAALGFGRGGASNHQVVGLQSAVNEITGAVRSAISQAEIAPNKPDIGCFCLAGADLPEDYELLQPCLDELGLVRKALIKNDTMAALRAGLTRPWGVVVICGTGFNAAGRAPDGREIALPSLGPLTGDWGGGGDLGVEIMRLVMRAWDGRGEPTLLTDMVLRYLHATSIEEFVLRIYHQEINERQLLHLAPLLFDAAQAGDQPACDLVIRMGTEIGVSANALIRRLDLQHDDVEVVLGGSVFKGQGPLLLDTIGQVVHAEAPQAHIVTLKHEPVAGAVLLALEALGIAIDRPIRERLGQSLANMGL